MIESLEQSLKDNARVSYYYYYWSAQFQAECLCKGPISNKI